MNRSLTGTALFLAILAPHSALADPAAPGAGYNGCPSIAAPASQCESRLARSNSLHLTSIKTLSERDSAATDLSVEAAARRAAPNGATVSAMAPVEVEDQRLDKPESSAFPRRRNAFFALLLSGGSLGR